MNENAPERRVRQGMDYGEDSDVHQVHAAIQREKREPRVGLEPLSIWLIAVYGLAIFFGGAYLGRFSGNFSGDSLDPALIPQPKTHGPSGPGGEQATELSQADRGKKIFSAMIVLKGLQGPLTVKGQSFGAAVMQPWDKTLSDAKIADVLTYIRQEWGNKGGPVATAQIAGLRKELASHPDSFVEADLKAVPEDAELSGGEPAGAKPAEAKSPVPAPPK